MYCYKYYVFAGVPAFPQLRLASGAAFEPTPTRPSYRRDPAAERAAAPDGRSSVKEAT